jgi:hypothetical protein
LAVLLLIRRKRSSNVDSVWVLLAMMHLSDLDSTRRYPIYWAF